MGWEIERTNRIYSLLNFETTEKGLLPVEIKLGKSIMPEALT